MGIIKLRNYNYWYLDNYKSTYLYINNNLNSLIKLVSQYKKCYLKNKNSIRNVCVIFDFIFFSTYFSHTIDLWIYINS